MTAAALAYMAALFLAFAMYPPVGWLLLVPALAAVALSGRGSRDC